MSERPKKPPSQGMADNPPWLPVPWTDETAGALQALEQGRAAEHQQKLALDFIINGICDTYGFHFYADSQNNTNFALGRAFAGQQIVKILKLNLTALRTTRRGEQG